MTSVLYTIDKNLLMKSNIKEVITFLTNSESMSDSSFLAFFEYFTSRLDIDSREDLLELSRLLNDIKVVCPTGTDNYHIMRCAARKLLLQDYINGRFTYNLETIELIKK